MDIYITITGFAHYFGKAAFDLGKTFSLKKEPGNDYDPRAIGVYCEKLGKCGYVANSPQTIAFGTMSAGALHDYMDKTARAQVKFIAGDYIIAKII